MTTALPAGLNPFGPTAADQAAAAEAAKSPVHFVAPPQRPNVDAQYPVASWEVVGALKVPFSFTHCQYIFGNRLVARERLSRDGAKQDDTGAKPDGYVLHVPWLDPNKEDGLSTTATQYPAEMLRLVAALKIHQTGTLTLPLYGAVRCRFEGGMIDTDAGQYNTAAGALTFHVDNEDTTDLASFVTPAALSVLVIYATQAAAQCRAAGVYSLDVPNLARIAGQIAALAAAPGRLIDNLQDQADELVASVGRIFDAFASSTNAIITAPGSTSRLLSARAHAAGQSLRLLADTASRVASTIPGQPATRDLVFSSPTSIVRVASLVGQDVDSVFALNVRFRNPARIPAGTPIKVAAEGLPTNIPGAR